MKTAKVPKWKISRIPTLKIWNTCMFTFSIRFLVIKLVSIPNPSPTVIILATHTFTVLSERQGVSGG